VCGGGGDWRWGRGCPPAPPERERTYLPSGSTPECCRCCHSRTASRGCVVWSRDSASAASSCGASHAPSACDVVAQRAPAEPCSPPAPPLLTASPPAGARSRLARTRAQHESGGCHTHLCLRRQRYALPCAVPPEEVACAYGSFHRLPVLEPEQPRRAHGCTAVVPCRAMAAERPLVHHRVQARRCPSLYLLPPLSHNGCSGVSPPAGCDVPPQPGQRALQLPQAREGGRVATQVQQGPRSLKKQLRPGVHRCIPRQRWAAEGCEPPLV
jgi:hypothetical protein